MVYIPKKTRTEEIMLLKERAIGLYFTGMTTREVGGALGKSYTWVANAVNEYKKKKSKQAIDK